jgi:hypothetical protein
LGVRGIYRTLAAGQRVKSAVGATLTAFIGNYFEWTGSSVAAPPGWWEI